ncbi:glycosyl hydrolase family 18 protein [Priestia koreensis]|uniref:glycosyl hydrolase family 18 protein n=1 Tax=Priestia koreensis TaxID=284581 RepID=UPI001F59E144|nr:glycoside hydrolase family 18 protein [Priestia koreensis]UNL85047.1 glycoside hydrolase family 18 protein [Priestia koreensis]
MQIYVVKPKDSIYTISRLYNVPPDLIINANQLPNPNRLVIGQAIVIPTTGSSYLVQPGDTIWKIGQKFGVSYQKIANANGIPVTQPLQAGKKITIPQKPKRPGEFFGYIETSNRKITPEIEKLVNQNAIDLTYLGPANFEIKRDGTLKAPDLNNFAEITKEHKVAYSMVLTNIEEGAFSDKLGTVILNNKDIQDKLLNTIVETAKTKGFKDIHMDFEFLKAEDKEAYLAFLRKAKERLNKESLLMSVALAPKTSANQKGQWYAAHDYKAIGEIADFIIIMTYEWGYSGGPPMAVSPIDPVRDVLEYAVKEIPSSKILMGQNLYGYDWTLPYQKGGKPAQGVSPQRAIQLAAEHNVAIQYDQEAQAPHFNYRDQQGKQHEVWFEDARSIQAKFNLLKELNLRGMAYWKLGLPFPQNWLLLEDNFQVVKKV